MPLVLPPMVLGYLLLVLLGPRARSGAGCSRPAASTGVHSDRRALASAILAFPLRCGHRLGIEAMDPGTRGRRARSARRPVEGFRQDHPAAGVGGHRGRRRSHASPRSLGELGAIITFVSNIPGQTRTLPLAIYTAIQTPGGEAAAARLAMLSMCAGHWPVPHSLFSDGLFARGVGAGGALWPADGHCSYVSPSAMVAFRCLCARWSRSAAKGAASPHSSVPRGPARPASCGRLPG